MTKNTRNLFNESEHRRIARRKALVRQMQEAALVQASFERKFAEGV